MEFKSIYNHPLALPVVALSIMITFTVMIITVLYNNSEVYAVDDNLIKGRIYFQYIGDDGKLHVYYRTFSSIIELHQLIDSNINKNFTSSWIVRTQLGNVIGGGT